MPAESTPAKRVSIPLLLPADSTLFHMITTHADWQCAVMILEVRAAAEYRPAAR